MITAAVLVGVVANLMWMVWFWRSHRPPMPDPTGLRAGDRVVCGRRAHTFTLQRDGGWKGSNISIDSRHRSTIYHSVPWEYLTSQYRSVQVCQRLETRQSVGG